MFDYHFICLIFVFDCFYERFVIFSCFFIIYIDFSLKKVQTELFLSIYTSFYEIYFPNESFLIKYTHTKEAARIAMVRTGTAIHAEISVGSTNFL